MKKHYIWTTAAAVLVLFLQACSKDNVSDYSVSGGNCDTISFAAKIQPLVEQNCTTGGCHGPGSPTGYEFTSHGTIAANATPMLKAMRWENGVQMPQGMPQLPDSLIQQFSCWIDQGKQDN